MAKKFKSLKEMKEVFAYIMGNHGLKVDVKDIHFVKQESQSRTIRWARIRDTLQYVEIAGINTKIDVDAYVDVVTGYARVMSGKSAGLNTSKKTQGYLEATSMHGPWKKTNEQTRADFEKRAKKAMGKKNLL